MPAIRYRHNYRKVVLNHQGALYGSGISGNRIAVLLRNGEESLHPFAGFMPRDRLSCDRGVFVKLVNIEAYSTDDDGLTGMQTLPPVPILGWYSHGHVFVVLERHRPVSLTHKKSA